MSKIGILTFFGVPNCGTLAQTYALRNVIEFLCPHDEVYQINYLNNEHKKLYGIGSQSTEEVDKKCNEMFWEYYNGIPHIDINNKGDFLNIKFDCLILGSDIIWDFAIKEFGEDEFLFGLDINCDYKISYAASFGTCKPEWKRFPNYVEIGLKELNRISVRDKKSIQIVKNISNRNAELCLDPIWLWDWNSDNRIKTPNYSLYIFVYGEDFSEQFKENLRVFALKRNLKIIAYGSRKYDYSWCDYSLDLSSTNPFEVIGYFKNADYVATSTFHGIMFSLFFRKKMAYYKTDFIESKVKDFLEDIKIYEKYSDSNDVNRMYETTWNFEEIDNILFEKKEKSIKYLHNCLMEGRS